MRDAHYVCHTVGDLRADEAGPILFIEGCTKTASIDPTEFAQPRTVMFRRTTLPSGRRLNRRFLAALLVLVAGVLFVMLLGALREARTCTARGGSLTERASGWVCLPRS